MSIIELLSKEEKKYVVFRRIKNGTTIYKENDLCTHISIIIDGRIKISSYTLNGEEIVFNIVGKEQIFENNLVFSSNPYYKGDVVAVEDTTLATINKNDLLKILMNNKSFLEMYLEIQSDFSKTLNFRIKLLAIENAKERLLFYLQENNQMISYKTITALAVELGLQRETLSRAITHLVKNGIITNNNKQLKIIR